MKRESGVPARAAAIDNMANLTNSWLWVVKEGHVTLRCLYFFLAHYYIMLFSS